MTLQITITSTTRSRSKQLSCLCLQRTKKSNLSLASLSLSSSALSPLSLTTTTTTVATTNNHHYYVLNNNSYSTTTSTTTPTSSTGINNKSSNNNVGGGSTAAAATKTIKKNDNNSKDIFQNASDFWSTIRYKVAMALTTSLSTTERDELLRRLKVNSTTTTDSTPKKNNNETTTTTEKDSSTDKETVRQSIAEAVAIARIEEAQHLKNKWDKEKEQLLANMELATTERIKNEIKILQHKQLKFNKWQNDVLNETTKTSTTTTGSTSSDTTNTNTNTDPTTTSSSTTIPVDNVVLSPPTTAEVDEQQQQQQQQNQYHHHPLLGTMLFDLGYKRIYTVSASVLQTLPVWKKQRIYRHSRAKDMATDKLKSLHLGFPGIISLYESTTSTSTSTGSDSVADTNEQVDDVDNDNDTTTTGTTSTSSLSIIDGQHRVGMMTMLQEKLAKQKNTDDESLSVLNFDHVLVEVYSASYLSNNNNNTSSTAEETTTTEKEQKLVDEELATDLFLEVNKAEPVKLIDMPGVVKKRDHTIITNGATYLLNKYPEMFSTSQKCRIPNVNIDNLRDAIYASNVLQRHTITTTKQLLFWLDTQNTKLETKYTDTTTTTTTIPLSVSKSAIDKATKYKFYLGLESGWLYE